jgi:hypothetical protein
VVHGEFKPVVNLLQAPGVDDYAEALQVYDERVRQLRDARAARGRYSSVAFVAAAVVQRLRLAEGAESGFERRMRCDDASDV